MDKQNESTQFLLYKAENGKIKVDVLIQDETVWLTQEQMAELFGRDRTVISKHIKNIFVEGELDENMVCANFAHTTKHGAIENKTQTTTIKYYNLDIIISVGYRVKSLQGTRFRQWATQHLKEFIIKGFTFLQFNEKEVLEHKGKISHEVAVALALNEYEKYRVIQDREYISDFDKLLLEMEDKI